MYPILDGIFIYGWFSKEMNANLIILVLSLVIYYAYDRLPKCNVLKLPSL